MKKATVAVIAMALSLPAIQANVLDFSGFVTSVNANPVIKVGDAVHIKVNYAPSSNVITRLTVSVNDSSLNLIRSLGNGNFVAIDENPVDGTVQWMVTTNSGTAVDVATNTSNGVIPCIDDFDLGKTFQIVLNDIIATGTVTQKPKTRLGQ